MAKADAASYKLDVKYESRASRRSTFRFEQEYPDEGSNRVPHIQTHRSLDGNSSFLHLEKKKE